MKTTKPMATEMATEMVMVVMEMVVMAESHF